MKKEYVIAMGVNRKNSGYKFTRYKSYEILGWFGRSAEVLDDDGKRCFIAVGAPTMRLDGGQFVKVNFPHAQEAMKSAERAAEYALKAIPCASGWRLEKDGVFIASGNFNATDKDPNVEVLEKLREILRVPEGENILTHAKVVRTLADGLINLQK